MVEKKGMTMALSVIISIVVLIVIALAVISITSGSLSIFGGTATETTGKTGGEIVGAAACSHCAIKDDQGDASALNDKIYSLPVYCQQSDGSEYCCTDLTHQKCATTTQCGSDVQYAALSTCTPA